jgi:hypothetical protein
MVGVDVLWALKRLLDVKLQVILLSWSKLTL